MTLRVFFGVMGCVVVIGLTIWSICLLDTYVRFASVTNVELDGPRSVAVAKPGRLGWRQVRLRTNLPLRWEAKPAEGVLTMGPARERSEVPTEAFDVFYIKFTHEGELEFLQKDKDGLVVGSFVLYGTVK